MITEHQFASIKSIEPNQLSSYLSSTGWCEDGKISDIATIWHRPEEDEYEIIQPLYVDLKDYNQRVYDLLNLLSEFNGQRIDQLILDITEEHPEGVAGPARPDPELPPPVESALPTVGGAVTPDSPFYIERRSDAEAYRLIAQPEGVTLTIRGPRQIGKSSLLQRLAATATTAGKQVAYINVQSDFDAADLADADPFYRRFFGLLALKLDLDDRTEDPQAWSPKLSNNGNGNRYLRKQILARLDGPLVLAMDELDRIVDAPFATDFFGMLRGWHNDRGMKPELKHLDLVLVISTEPSALIANAHQSPFNVATPIELDDFDLEQVRRLDSLHDGCLGATGPERLQNLLNGHPYLTRSALYHIATGRCRVEELFANALRTDSAGPFADHLGRYRRHLAEDPVLSTAMAAVIKHRAYSQDLKNYHRLLWLGLIRETAESAERLSENPLVADGSTKISTLFLKVLARWKPSKMTLYEPRNRLYQDFFARYL